MLNTQSEFIAAPLGVVEGEGGWTGKAFPASAETRDGMVIERVLVRPDDNGTALVVPRDMLRAEGENRFVLPLPRSAANAYVAGSSDLDEAKVLSGERIVVPVIEETVSVGKRWVETEAGVRVTKTVSTHEEIIEQPLMRERVTVERIPVNRVVESAPAQREEGDVLIVPIMEEVLVIGKRLLLKEELRISRTREQVQERQVVTLRREEAHVAPLLDESAGGEEGVGISSPTPVGVTTL